MNHLILEFILYRGIIIVTDYAVDFFLGLVVKNTLYPVVETLNQPSIKEFVKNTVGLVTFIFGLIQLFMIVRNRLATSFTNFTIQSTRLSIILSAIVSRPSLGLISIIIDQVFTPEELESIFGPNTLFILNPYHPRHIASMAALTLALPAIFLSSYRWIVTIYQKIRKYRKISKCRQKKNGLFADAQCQMFILFNMLTSRPILHIGNQIGRLIILSH